MIGSTCVTPECSYVWRILFVAEVGLSQKDKQKNTQLLRSRLEIGTMSLAHIWRQAIAQIQLQRNGDVNICQTLIYNNGKLISRFEERYLCCFSSW